MSDKVLISKKLFLNLIEYYFFDKLDLEDCIKSDLEIKLNSLVKHENYTNYLNEQDPKKKDEFLNKYLSSKNKFTEVKSDAKN